MGVSDSTQIQKIGFNRLESLREGKLSLSILNAGLNYFGIYFPEGKPEYFHFERGSYVWKAIDILVNFAKQKGQDLKAINVENIDALLEQYGGEEKFLKDIGEGQAVVKKCLENIRNADLPFRIKV